MKKLATFICFLSSQTLAQQADNIFLVDAPAIPSSSIDLVKNEFKKKDAETLNNIKGAFSSIIEDKNDHEKKHTKQKYHLDAPIHKAMMEAIEKKELVSKEIHNLLAEQYNHPQLNDTIVSCTFKQAPLREAIALIGKLTGIQFICDESVNGAINNFSVKDITASQALHILLTNALPRLALLHEHGIWRITQKSYATEALRFQAEDLLEQAYIQSNKTMFNVAWNDAFKARIEKLWTTMVAKDISKLSYLAFDDTTKKIFFKGKKDIVKNFEATLTEIDIIIPQVRIDVRVIIAEKDFEEALGFDFSGIYDRKASVKHFDFIGVGPNTNTTDARGNPLFSDLVTWSLNFIPSFRPNIKIPFVFGGKDLDTKRLNITLNAAEQKSEIKTILKPSLLVNNEEIAEILVGEEMPQSTRLDETVEGQLTNITTINYKDVGMKIRVKPTVTPSLESIILEMYVENSHVKHPHIDRIEGNKTTSTFNYTIETSRSKNKVSLKSGQTTLISGLMLNYKENEQQGIPVLQDIPILGWFFRGSKTVVKDKQLLIFITPTLI